MNNNELKILNLSEGYLIFIDETGDSFVHFDLEKYKDPSIFPVMTVAALIVSRLDYQNILLPGINKIKNDFFHKETLCLHFREIRRKDGIFKLFLDENIYSKFKDEMDSLIANSRIQFVVASIDKIKLVEKAKEFKKKTGSSYKVGDIYLRDVEYVLERIAHFLDSCKQNGKIIFETRGGKESKKIQGVLDAAKLNGTFYHSKDVFNLLDREILFFNKKDNINGLQLVDYCVYSFDRHAKNPLDSNNKFFNFLRQFIYKGDFWEYGLKEWP